MKKLCLLLVLPLLISCKGESEKLKRAGKDVDAHYFLYGDFGSLTVGGFQRMTQPYRIANVARAMKDGQPRDVNIVEYTKSELEKFGLVYPEKVLNLPDKARIADWNESPIGIIDGFMENKLLRVNGASIGCATCHAGRVYNRKGLPTNDVWLGLPNTSVNLEAYTQSVMGGLSYITQNREIWDKFKKQYRRSYRNKKEYKSLSTLGPDFRPQIQRFAQRSGRLSPYMIGVPGMTNGMGALKTQMGVLDKYDFYKDEVGFVSIPVLADRGFRSSLLVDGIYGVNGEEAFYEINQDNFGDPGHLDGLAKIVAVFLIPTMGNKPKQIEENLNAVRRAFNFVKDIEMPLFPGDVNFRSARRGRQTYDSSCAKCHGEYWGPVEDLKLVSFPNKLVPLEKIGTDPARVELTYDDAIDELNESEAGQFTNAVPTKGYVAPILTGLWTSAPYLHNGSVPSLWALMNPEERPDEFYIGGHAFDYRDMGVAYPEGYIPFSMPYLYVTSKPGFSNKGHEKPFTDMNADTKRDLIEFLKLL